MGEMKKAIKDISESVRSDSAEETGAGQHCMRGRKIESRMKAFLHYSKLGSIHMTEHTICSWKKITDEKKSTQMNPDMKRAR